MTTDNGHETSGSRSEEAEYLIRSASQLYDEMYEAALAGVSPDTVARYYPRVAVHPTRADYEYYRSRTAARVVCDEVLEQLGQPNEDTTPDEFVRLTQLGLTSVDAQRDLRRGVLVSDFWRQVRAGALNIITRSDEDREQLRKKLVDVNKYLMDQSDYTLRNHLYLFIAGKTPDEPVDRSAGEIEEAQEAASRDFWMGVREDLRAHTLTSEETKAQMDLSDILSPHPLIRNKDPNKLLDWLDLLDEQGLQQAVGAGPSKPATIETTAYDIFRRILLETAQDGWSNASGILKALEGASRDMPYYLRIISLANLLTPRLNRRRILPGGLRLEMLRSRRPHQIPEQVAEAIDRCLYTIFEFGSRPAGGDPLNYLIMGNIVSALFHHTRRDLPASKIGTAALNTTEEDSAARREQQQASQDANYWRSWKSRYGI